MDWLKIYLWLQIKKYSLDTDISVSSSADATLDIAADGDINLTAGADINVPANVGLTFGNDDEKIEGVMAQTLLSLWKQHKSHCCC